MSWLTITCCPLLLILLYLCQRSVKILTRWTWEGQGFLLLGLKEDLILTSCLICTIGMPLHVPCAPETRAYAGFLLLPWGSARSTRPCRERLRSSWVDQQAPCAGRQAPASQGGSYVLLLLNPVINNSWCNCSTCRAGNKFLFVAM